MDYEITFTIKDTGKRVTIFNDLCRYHGVNPASVWARQSMDGVSVAVTMLLFDAENICASHHCPAWLLEKIEAASFNAVKVCTLPKV